MSVKAEQPNSVGTARLEVEGLTVKFKRQRAVDSVSFQLRPGAFVGLLGPNGSGKSTLLRTCAGLHPPSAGNVLLGDREVRRMSAAERARQLAYTPQHPEPHAFSVHETLEMALYTRANRFLPLGRRHAVLINRAMKANHLKQIQRQRFDTLSGGERQRVAFARSVVQDTPVLLLDEPTASMDLKYLTLTMLNLQRLAKRGRLVLMALHNLEQAARYCDHLLLLHNGRLVSSGSAQQVLTPSNLAAIYGVDAEMRISPITGQLQLHLRGLSANNAEGAITQSGSSRPA